MINLAASCLEGDLEMTINGRMLFCLALIASSFVLCSPDSEAAPAKKAAPSKKPAAPAAKSAPSSGGGSSAALNGYANQLRQKMGANWNYPNGHNNVTLTVKVNQDGSVSDLSLTSSPKSDEAEQKANDALNSAQPLPSLPSGVSGATITAVFDSHTDANGQDCKAGLSVKIDPVKGASPGPSEGDSSTTEKKDESK